ncbi:MAG: hypothetical protein JKZ03_07825 [Flavobacteriaceae bacterium]|nr:hypothetical protein [Flavobacteriaceae bacterium]
MPHSKNIHKGKIMNAIAGILLFFLFCFLPHISTAQSQDQEFHGLVKHFKHLTKATKWTLLDTVKLKFQTYHTQGLLMVGDYFYLSAVETIEAPEKYSSPIDGNDRSPGKGIGYLFKFDKNGSLVSKTQLGEATIYHPGGIDFDGQNIWVPVAEYRPNSQSIIYKINPENLSVKEMFRFKDHIGGLSYNIKDQTLHGINWGSKRMYTWKANDQTINPEQTKIKLKSSYYIDYQDCHYVPNHFMLCGGVNKYKVGDMGEIALGGLELINLRNYTTVHQIPVPLWVKPNLVMTNNPFFFKIREASINFYFIPEDDNSTLYIYQAK